MVNQKHLFSMGKIIKTTLYAISIPILFYGIYWSCLHLVFAAFSSSPKHQIDVKKHFLEDLLPYTIYAILCTKQIIESVKKILNHL